MILQCTKKAGESVKQGFIKESIGSRIFDKVNLVLMIGFASIMLFPFLNIIALSLNDGVDAARGGIYLWPREFSLDSYKVLFQNEDLLKGFGISILRVVVGTVTGVLCTGLLAYIVTVKHFSGRKFMRLLFVFTMFFSGGLIPTYLLFMKLGLSNTFTVYWLPALFSPFFMLLMASYIQNLPDSIFESARMDGCSELRIYFQILIPMSIPVFAAIAVFSAVGHWNSWFDVLIYNPSGEWDTLQVYLRRLLLEVEAIQQVQDLQLAYSKYRNISPITLRAATTVLVTLPIIFVYPFAQKYFVGGITLGSVKE